MSYFENKSGRLLKMKLPSLKLKSKRLEAAMLENASDYGQLASLQRDLDATNESLLEKYERYEYLSELEG